ncbi:MAG: hypothetical protein JWR67_3177, partial [Mucilaginibacter sp.]|nr:hypothetical protein [Mucilaginibacter sp.]
MPSKMFVYGCKKILKAVQTNSTMSLL